MTIYLYSGTPGSGKSLHAARIVRWRLEGKHPKPVIVNFPINRNAVEHPELCYYKPNVELTPDWLMDFADEYWLTHEFHEDYLTLILDECQLLFNSRSWQDITRKEWLAFFSQHRKYGFKVIFIAQSDIMVDKQFRVCIEYEVKHRKLSTAGAAGWLLALPFGGRVFVENTRNYQDRMRVDTDFVLGKRRDMALYDTRERFRAAT